MSSPPLHPPRGTDTNNTTMGDPPVVVAGIEASNTPQPQTQTQPQSTPQQEPEPMEIDDEQQQQQPVVNTQNSAANVVLIQQQQPVVDSTTTTTTSTTNNNATTATISNTPLALLSVVDTRTTATATTGPIIGTGDATTTAAATTIMTTTNSVNQTPITSSTSHILSVPKTISSVVVGDTTITTTATTPTPTITQQQSVLVQPPVLSVAAQQTTTKSTTTTAVVTTTFPIQQQQQQKPSATTTNTMTVPPAPPRQSVAPSPIVATMKTTSGVIPVSVQGGVPPPLSFVIQQQHAASTTTTSTIPVTTITSATKIQEDATIRRGATAVPNATITTTTPSTKPTIVTIPTPQSVPLHLVKNTKTTTTTPKSTQVPQGKSKPGAFEPSKLALPPPIPSAVSPKTSPTTSLPSGGLPIDVTRSKTTTVAQSSLAASTMTTTPLSSSQSANTTTTTAAARVDVISSPPTGIRDGISSENPLLSHPGIRPTQPTISAAVIPVLTIPATTVLGVIPAPAAANTTHPPYRKVVDPVVAISSSSSSTTQKVSSFGSTTSQQSIPPQQSGGTPGVKRNSNLSSTTTPNQKQQQQQQGGSGGTPTTIQTTINPSTNTQYHHPSRGDDSSAKTTTMAIGTSTGIQSIPLLLPTSPSKQSDISRSFRTDTNTTTTVQVPAMTTIPAFTSVIGNPKMVVAVSSLSGSSNHNHRINWEGLRKRLMDHNYMDATNAALEIKRNMIHIGKSTNTEFQLFLTTLLPAFSSILTSSGTKNIIQNYSGYRKFIMDSSNTTSSSSSSSSQQPPVILHLHKVRYIVLEIIRSMPKNDTLRLYAPQLIAVGMDVLISSTNLVPTTTPSPTTQQTKTSSSSSESINKNAAVLTSVHDNNNQNFMYCEENAVQAAHIIFELYKHYRSLPHDSIQKFLDFVIAVYRALPNAVQTSFSRHPIYQAVTMSSVVHTTMEQQPISITPTTPAAASPLMSQFINPLPGTPTPPLFQTPIHQQPSMSTVAPSAYVQQGVGSGVVHGYQPIVPSPLHHQSTTTSLPPTFTASQTNKTMIQQGGATSSTPSYMQQQLPSPQTPHSTSSISPSSFLRTSSGMQHSSSSSSTSSTYNISSNNTTFRILTECPLIVFHMFQLYPRYIKSNILVLIQVMTEALGLRVPPIHVVLPDTGTPSAPEGSSVHHKGTSSSSSPSNKQQKSNTGSGSTSTNTKTPSDLKMESSMKRLYFSRAREFIASQAKTLSFLTYILRTFTNELKAYEDRLATNVVALMSACPRESINTRRELLSATKCLLGNSDFRQGFFKHIDTLLDARVLMGTPSQYHSYQHHYYNSTSYRFSDQASLRPLGYSTLADFIQHARHIVNMGQISRAVGIFSRVLHEHSTSMIPLPLTIQCSAVRTLLVLAEAAYQRKDPNPQLGRDILCRIMDTLVDKLHALILYFPTVLEAETNNMKRYEGTNTQTTQSISTIDTVRDVHTIIRVIIVGFKTMTHYTNSYRRQIEKRSSTPPVSASSNVGGTSESSHSAQQTVSTVTPAGSNDEVSSATQKITRTEIAIIDRYILAAIPAIKLLKVNCTMKLHESKEDTTEKVDKACSPSSSSANTAANEKSLAEHHREACSNFAAAFSSLDVSALRLLLGKRMEYLVDFLVDDAVAMLIPRHLLSFNRVTSYEFCSILLDYLVGRMHLLGLQGSEDHILFLEEPESISFRGDDATAASSRTIFRKQVHEVYERPQESAARMKGRSMTLLHLFERVLKSLSMYPDNEKIVRRHLRRMVVSSFRSAMENIANWSDNYCMLLRHIFISISDGKFEESYKELLPLIPSVLNGLYRVIVSTCDQDQRIIRYMSIELCLTIPALFTSLLPHMNLLLRIVISALDSMSSELVELGLRTLEFWVDNLNPQFLYPEIAKESELFSLLMQALSRHLRPAPYPLGLLTLRLLGKLGGKNREFLRYPMAIKSDRESKTTNPSFTCSMFVEGFDLDNIAAFERTKNVPISIPIPLSRCLRSIRMIHRLQNTDVSLVSTLVDNVDNEQQNDRVASLWTCRVDDLDFSQYKKTLMNATVANQLKAGFAIVSGFVRNEILVSSTTQTAAHRGGPTQNGSLCSNDLSQACIYVCYACVIPDLKVEALSLLQAMARKIDQKIFTSSFSIFISDPSIARKDVGTELLSMLLRTIDEKDGSVLLSERKLFGSALIDSLCEYCRSTEWCRFDGLHEAILYVMKTFGSEWSRTHEVTIINVSMLCIKAIPREVSSAVMKALRFHILIFRIMYAQGGLFNVNSEVPILDVFSADKGFHDMERNVDNLEFLTLENPTVDETVSFTLPSEDIFRLILLELVSPQQVVRYAARYMFFSFFRRATPGSKAFFGKNLPLIRRVLFSRALRLLPLPQQTGVVEGLAVIVKLQHGALPLSDQHLLAFISELLKMLSVADGEMKDDSLKNRSVDKDGYTPCEESRSLYTYPTHATSIFSRRESIIDVEGIRLVIPEELPAGIQLRVSTIVLLHSVIVGYGEKFFEADWIGNIRPHVISLLFRSLVSTPLRAVDAAHFALRDVLSFTRSDTDENISKPQSRVPKELVQTCIRPVLMHLRDYVRLSPALLRGLVRLLSLLSSLFNKTLGEKLLDHLEKWNDPNRIISEKKWKEGEEPLVAAAIVGIFPGLPQAPHFVEPLVKTCIKLEECINAYRGNYVESPFRVPLARYLANHPNSTIHFFFQRLKTPMYSELFQFILELHEGGPIRAYLCKHCSNMILSVCFERPLTIIRSDKSSSSTGHNKNSLFVHGIGQPPPDAGTSSPRPMNVEALELQLQGFRIIQTLLATNVSYFKEQNDIVRAIRWLWRSKGRFFRLQHEDLISPRYHGESKMLASFLMSYAKTHLNEDQDILFELVRVFLQPTTGDFTYVSDFLVEMVSDVLTIAQQKKVLQRFFVIMTGNNDETKVLTIQYLLYPMLSSAFSRAGASIDGRQEVLLERCDAEKFVREVLFRNGEMISCGDRLTVELLRILSLFVQYHSTLMEPLRSDAMRFGEKLLKSEDTACKSWAYIVTCHCMAAYVTPASDVIEVFSTLINLHHPEGKELVRDALDVIVPVLALRLREDEVRVLVEHMSHLMLEDASTTTQSVHICQLLTRCSTFFYHYRRTILPQLMISASRLGLAPNHNFENVSFALDVASLVLEWRKRELASNENLLCLDEDQSIMNLLFRLKFTMTEHFDGKNSATSLNMRLDYLLEMIVSQSLNVLVEGLETMAKKSLKVSLSLVSCLQIFTLMLKYKHQTFFQRHSGFIQVIMRKAFKQGCDNPNIQKHLRSLTLGIMNLQPFCSTVIASLDEIIEEATLLHAKNNKPDGDVAKSAGHTVREKASETDSSSGSLSYALFALELVSAVCFYHSSYLIKIQNTLISFAKCLAEIHFASCKIRQRHSSSGVSQAISVMRHHTPTVGILDAIFFGDMVDNLKVVVGKGRSSVDDATHVSTPVKSLSLLLGLFEISDIMYTFTDARKAVLEILIGVVDTSDNAELLFIAMRFLARIMLSEGTGSPVTLDERKSLLLKMTSFDFCRLPDDITMHPIAEIVATFTIRYCEQNIGSTDMELKKLIIACSLNANESIRDKIMDRYDGLGAMVKGTRSCSCAISTFWHLLHSDLEGLASRFWITTFVDALMRNVSFSDSTCLGGLRAWAQGDPSYCQSLAETLLPSLWNVVEDDRLRLRLIRGIEQVCSSPFHNQFSLTTSPFFLGEGRSLNALRSFLNNIALLRPIPFMDLNLLLVLAENHNCWHEVLSLMELMDQAFLKTPYSEGILAAMRHSYKQLGEDDVWLSLARASCQLPKSKAAISCDLYSFVNEAVSCYSDLIELTDSPSADMDPTDFELDMWEERWITLQKELCQFPTVSEFATASESPQLELECAWKLQNWARVRALCTSESLFNAVEKGDPVVKLSETLLAVADGKLSDLENLHAQTAQLCLYKWQLLPKISSGSFAHSSLLHFFHRLVEIRESGKIMAETATHSSLKTLPEFKTVLNAWRYRLPNDWERMSLWDEIFAWRANMFSAVTSKFTWAKPSTLATLHDRPWTNIRMAKTARKQGMPDISLLLLTRVAEERTMNIPDAFFKVHEQILAYDNPSSELERQGGLNFINATNLSFFDAPQKGELMRLKAAFLQYLGGKTKANQAFCQSAQICPIHAKTWESWGGLCVSLGAAAEKQMEQESNITAGTDANSAKSKAAKNVAQYLAQAMGCYFEAIQLNSHEWARMHIAKCIWMLSKDGTTPGVLCQTFEYRGSRLPSWVWLPWLPTLLASLHRNEGKTIMNMFSALIKTYPQAVYYPLRAFYLERRDVDRGSVSASSPSQNVGSLSFAEELMSLLRKSHAPLWSSLEPILEELTVKFRPSYEEELLSTVIALLERVEVQVAAVGKKDATESFIQSAWKTLKRIAVKFFRSADSVGNNADGRSKKTALFKETYKIPFESDFKVTSVDDDQLFTDESLDLDDILGKLRKWRARLEYDVLRTPSAISLIESSHSLSIFGVGDAPDLWPGSCDPSPFAPRFSEADSSFDSESGGATPTILSSVSVARKAANTASGAAFEAAQGEGVVGDYGGGSSWIEVPGQYVPNTSSRTDARPSPELHAKIMRFESRVEVLRRNDQLVRRIGMIANDGSVYRFVLQFAPPYLTRTDERTAQTSYFLDKIFRKDMRSSRFHLSVQSFPVVPIAPRLRLVGEPDSRMSLEDVYKDFCESSNINHSSLASTFNEDVKNNLCTKISSSMTTDERQLVEKLIRREAYIRMRAKYESDGMLSRYMSDALIGAEQLYHFRRVFAQQWAINCLLQYVFSTAERTPGRIVFVENTGSVISPEFRTSYGNQGYMEKTILPFRFSPNLYNLIGPILLEARFIPSFAIAARAIHEYRHDIEPIWRLLMRDDLVAYYTKATAKPDAKLIEMEKQLVDRVARNVGMLSARFMECSPNPKVEMKNKDGQVVAIDQRVRDLINESTCPDNLAMMPGNYLAWI